MTIRTAAPACPDNDPDCLAQGCPEHPAHSGPDHTYGQHHAPGQHVGTGPCRCTAYLT